MIRTVRHPAFPNVTNDVPAKDARHWKAQGWIVDEDEKAEKNDGE